MPLLHHRLCRCFLFLAAALLFLTYPLAAIPFKTFSFMHQLAIPSQWLLSLAAVPVILTASSWPRRRFAIPALVILVSVVIGAATHRQLTEATVILAGYALIPWAAAVCLAGDDALPLPTIGSVVTFLWFTQIVSGLLAIKAGADPIGFSGNRNWFAATVLATAPWAAVRLSSRFAGAPRYRWAAIGGVAVLTGVVVWYCHSRGVILAALGAALLCLWWVLRRLERALLIILVVLLPITIASVYGRQVVRIMQLDVRLPMVGSTVAMTVDHDVTAAALATIVTFDTSHLRQLKSPLGVGPGQFRRTFTPYRAHSTYGERGTAAAVTIHPHNEFLNIASQIGLAAAIAWFILLLPFLQRPDWSHPHLQACRLGGLVLVISGAFDMTLVQPPSSLLAPLFIGFCWAPAFLPRRLPVPDTALANVRNSVAFAALLAAVLVGLRGVTRHWRLDQQRRLALFCDSTGRYQQAIDAYLRVTHDDPADIDSWYTAGRIAYKNLERPREAVGYLQKAAELDGNFAHVNALLGNAFLVTNRPDLAVACLERECRLYPYGADAWQLYFTALLFDGKCQQLPAVGKHLADIVRQRTLALHGESRLQHLLADWYDAVEKGDPERAISLASTITQPLPTGLVDPAFHLATPGQDWPVDFVTDSYNMADYAYWRQLVFARHLLADAPSSKPEQTLRYLVTSLHDRLQIDPKATPAYLFPNDLWEQRRGNPVAAWYAFAFLARCAGFWVHLQAAPDGTPTGCLAFTPNATWSVDLPAGTIAPWPTDKPRPAGWQGVYLFQEMLGKNRALGVLAHDYLPGLPILFDESPTLNLLYMSAVEGAKECPTLDQLSARIATAQLRQLYASIEAARARPKPPEPLPTDTPPMP